jgi:hypothetical protein
MKSARRGLAFSEHTMGTGTGTGELATHAEVLRSPARESRDEERSGKENAGHRNRRGDEEESRLQAAWEIIRKVREPHSTVRMHAG